MLPQAVMLMAAAGPAMASTKDPALMPTPPMGFNNWARFECALNETLFVQTADAMASNGLLASGYNRINIDDCWPLHRRAANGTLQWDPELFPKGLIWLGQYLKKKGFQFGIYSDAGNTTCGGYPGSLGHEELDHKTFVSWGIDYLKLDGCNVEPRQGQTSEARYHEIYSHWHSIFASSKDPLIFSESAPAYFSEDTGAANFTDWYTVMDWVPFNGELARHSADIATHKSTKTPWDSVMFNYGQEVRLARLQQPGYFNDPDFLIADELYLNLEEKRSHFALWASFGAPLIVSAYIPDLSDEVVAYLTHKPLIDVDQDALGLQASLVSRDGTWDVLSRTLSNGDRLLTMLNNGSSSASYSVPVARFGWEKAKQGCQLTVTDLWTGKTQTLDACHAGAAVTTQHLPSHGTAVFRIQPQEKKAWTPTGMIFNTASLKCLTAPKNKGTIARWAACDASDAQVWNIGAKGSSISNAGSCLAGLGSPPKVAMKPCSGGPGVTFTYGTSGNIGHAHSKTCLTEASDGSVELKSCGHLKNRQVFEVPSGWQL